MTEGRTHARFVTGVSGSAVGAPGSPPHRVVTWVDWACPLRSQRGPSLSPSPWVLGDPAGLWSPGLPSARPVPARRQAGTRGRMSTPPCDGHARPRAPPCLRPTLHPGAPAQAPEASSALWAPSPPGVGLRILTGRPAYPGRPCGTERQREWTDHPAALHPHRPRARRTPRTWTPWTLATAPCHTAADTQEQERRKPRLQPRFHSHRTPPEPPSHTGNSTGDRVWLLPPGPSAET